MGDHPGLPVSGYKPQPTDNIVLVNANKRIEEQMLRMIDALSQHDDIDKRWLAIGRTNIETGMMAVNRAIFKPGRIALPDDAG